MSHTQLTTCHVVEVDPDVIKWIETLYRLDAEMIDEYRSTIDGFCVPSVGEICRRVYDELWAEEKSELIEAAIMHKDYELYGYSDIHRFKQDVWDGSIEDETLTPKISFSRVQIQVIDYLILNQIFHTDYHNRYRNDPIVEVW